MGVQQFKFQYGIIKTALADSTEASSVTFKFQYGITKTGLIAMEQMEQALDAEFKFQYGITKTFG